FHHQVNNYTGKEADHSDHFKDPLPSYQTVQNRNDQTRQDDTTGSRSKQKTHGRASFPRWEPIHNGPGARGKIRSRAKPADNTQGKPRVIGVDKAHAEAGYPLDEQAQCEYEADADEVRQYARRDLSYDIAYVESAHECAGLAHLHPQDRNDDRDQGRPRKTRD